MSKRTRDIRDFNDLLFEGRNKDYGAYQLRKRYNLTVVEGIIISSVLVSLAVIIPFILTPHSDHVYSGGIRYVQVKMENLEPPKDAVFVPPPPAPPEEIKTQEVVKYVPPVVVDTILSFKTTQATADEMLAQPSNTNLEGVVGGTGTGEDLLSGEDGIISDEPFFLVEVMPSFKGGDINKFREWVMKRTNYPQAAIDKKIQGRVFLTFIVEPDGTVSSVTVVKGVDPLIDNEAVKSIQSSPKWNPGLQRGQAVRVRFSMWLNFVY